MRILAFAQYYPPEIAANGIRLHGLLRALAERGHQVTVLTAVPNYPQRKIYPGYEKKRLEVLDGVIVKRHNLYLSSSTGLLSRFLTYFTLMVAILFRAFREKRPDVVIAPSPPLFSALAAWIWSYLFRVPFILDLQDLWPESIQALNLKTPSLFLSLASFVARRIYRKARRITTVAQGIKTYLVEKMRVSPGKVKVIYNSLDLFPKGKPPELPLKIKEELGLTGKFVVLYAGNLGLAQNPITLVEAAEFLREKQDIFFLILGGGVEEERLRRIVKEKSLQNFRLLGPVPREKLPRFYTASDIGVVLLRDTPLFDSALPTKLFEYWSHALPVVAGVRGEARDLIVRAQGGLVFPPESAHGLAEAILMLKENQALREDLGRNGLSQVERTFNGKVQSITFVQLVEEAGSAED